MTFNRVLKVTNNYENCTLCNLSEKRVAKKESICLGQGITDAVGLIIVPQIVLNDSDRPGGVYGSTTQELKMLKAIWASLKMDPDDWWLTAAVACPGIATHDHMKACNTRLGDLVQAISPAVVVCCGIDSVRSFLCQFDLDSKSINKGWLKNTQHYRTFYTYDFSNYIANKVNNVEGWENVAKEIMDHWTIIAKQVEEIKQL